MLQLLLLIMCAFPIATVAAVSVAAAPATKDPSSQEQVTLSQVLPLDGSTPKQILFRSTPLTEQDFAGYKELGIRTILNLDSLETNESFDNASGLQVINVPFPAFKGVPALDSVDYIAQILVDTRVYPMVVYGKNAIDRTGFVVGLYRVLVEGVSADLAYREMIKKNFRRPVQVQLKCAFFDAVEARQSSECKALSKAKRRVHVQFAAE